MIKNDEVMMPQALVMTSWCFDLQMMTSWTSKVSWDFMDEFWVWEGVVVVEEMFSQVGIERIGKWWLEKLAKFSIYTIPQA